MCLDSATQVIELYNHMLENKFITWTRGYFQVIFAAGLSDVYCVSLGLHEDIAKSEQDPDSLRQHTPGIQKGNARRGQIRDRFLHPRRPRPPGLPRPVAQRHRAALVRGSYRSRPAIEQ